MILAAGFAAIAIFFAGCGEECGPQCPPEISESPPAVDVLVVTGFAFPGMSRIFHDPLIECGALLEGSVVDTFSLLDYSRALVIPAIEYLRQYDALLVFTDAWPEGHGTFETYAYDTIGNLLADYVDSGGGIVMCQFTISGLAAGIRGRIVSPGYAPLKVGGWEMLSEEIDRSIILESLEFPLHPVFTGVDIEQVRLCSVRSGIGRPELDETAVLLASDDMGTNAVAVNASGSIVGINTYYKSFAFPEEYAETIRLVANSLVFVSGVQLE
jgi:hypothetical protein